MLDVDEPGKKNWWSLANVFDVERKASQNFTKSIKDNPAETLLDHVKCKNPEMTVEYLTSILNKLKLLEVSEVLTKEG